MTQASRGRILTLADLADESTHLLVLAGLLEHLDDRPRAAVAMLHQALAAAADALLAPVAIEGIVYSIEADQIGLTNDLRTEAPRVWIGRRHEVVTIEPARHVVRAIHRVIDPIVELVIQHSGIGSRQANSFVLDELRVRCGQLAHTLGVGYTEGWPNDLLAAITPLARSKRLAA